MIDFRKISVVLAGLMMLVSMELFADGRPKVRVLGDKRYEQIEGTLVPFEKKEKWGFAETDGKPAIPAVFSKVMPFKDEAAFVAYELYEGGPLRWTLISMRGEYLTEREFTAIVSDFDDKGLAVVRDGVLYGLIDTSGKMVLDSAYSEYEQTGPVYVFKPESAKGLVVIADDNSEKGYLVHSFAGYETVIVKAGGFYGLVDKKTLRPAVPFEYDSFEELLPNSAYAFNKDGKTYLFTYNTLSKAYDSISLGVGKAYFVVQNSALYGVVNKENKEILSCSQVEIPILSEIDYRCFMESGVPVYVNAKRTISANEYDDYLYARYADSRESYVLDTTLDKAYKKYMDEVFFYLYGKPGFKKVRHLPEAASFMVDRKMILMSDNEEYARYLDLKTGRVMNAADVVYESYPSKDGSHVYASVKRGGKFGIVEIATGETLLPCEYDGITSLGYGYAVLQKADSAYLYSVKDTLMMTPTPYGEITSMESQGFDKFKLIDSDVVKIFDPKTGKWLFPDDCELQESVLQLNDGDDVEIMALLKKGTKMGVYSYSSGEQVVDFLFDQISPLPSLGLCQVRKGDKCGLYDVKKNKYILQCQYDYFSDEFYVHKGDTLIPVIKNRSHGLYNITKKKMALAHQCDWLFVRDGFVLLCKDSKYAIYSLDYNKMMFSSPLDNASLLNDGYAIINKGVFNLHYNDWAIDPMNVNYIISAGDDHVLIFGGYSDTGLANFKTSRWIVRDSDISNAEVFGNYAIIWKDDIYARLYNISKGEWMLNNEYEIMGIIEQTEENGLTSDYLYIGNDERVDLVNINKWAYVLRGIENESITTIEDNLLLLRYMDSQEVGIFDLKNQVWMISPAVGNTLERSMGQLFVHTQDNFSYRYIPGERRFKKVYAGKDKEHKRLSQMTDYQVVEKGGKYVISGSGLSKEATEIQCDRISLMYE